MVRLDNKTNPGTPGTIVTDKLLLRAFLGAGLERPPFWLMRQAGRYLPEYRCLRAEAPDFLSFCYSPRLTVEAALQPLRRYQMDAAILFSDILVVPDALGCRVRFVEGEGPRLEPVRTGGAVDRLRPDGLLAHLAPVFESLRALKQALAEEITLIGFAGAPWTIALYMVEGRGGTEGEVTRGLAYADPQLFGRMIELLVDATATYLKAQIDSGAEVVQIFDSWAGLLPESQFRRWVIAPTAEIVKRVKSEHPEVPIIGFPRGAGALYRDYAVETGVDGIGLDATVPLVWACEALQSRCLVQGNLDNLLLAAGGEALLSETARIVEAFWPGRYVFNLGHGVLPQTPPENVAAVAALIRGWSKRVVG